MSDFRLWLYQLLVHYYESDLNLVLCKSVTPYWLGLVEWSGNFPGRDVGCSGVARVCCNQNRVGVGVGVIALH